MTGSRPLLKGFAIGLTLFVMANLLAAQLLSDCGLQAVLGVDACADDIARAGFPLIFFEQGGFAYRSTFSLPKLLLDIFIGIGFATACGFVLRRLSQQKSPHDQ